MELFQVEIEGFKKFKDKTVLKTRGKVLAILGANEAGKSSLLKALQRLDDDEEFRPDEQSRGGKDNSTSVKATYLLSQEDRDAAEIKEGIWFDVTKSADGKLSCSIRPRPADRDYSHRIKLTSQLEGLGFKAKSLLEEMNENLFQDTQVILAQTLRGNSELSENDKQKLSEIVSRWQSAEGEDLPRRC